MLHMTHMIVIAKNDLGLSGGQVCTLFPNSSTSKKKKLHKNSAIEGGHDMLVWQTFSIFVCL